MSDRIYCFSHKSLDDSHPHLADALIQLAKPDRFDETIRILALHGVEVQVGARGWLEAYQEGVLLLTQEEKSYLANETLASDARPHYQAWLTKVENGECPFCTNEHPITGEQHGLLTEEEYRGWRKEVIADELGKTWCAHCHEHHPHDGEIPVGRANGILIAACPGGLYHPLGHERHSDERNLFTVYVDDDNMYKNCDVTFGKKHHATVRGNWRHNHG